MWRVYKQTFGNAKYTTGQDATEAFEDVGHSDEARALLPGMLVGEFEKGSVSPDLTPRPPNA